MSENTHGRGRRVSGENLAKSVAGTTEHAGLCGSLCGKNKKAEQEESAGMTYQDYLNERGYKPLCCDNSGEDLWTIFCSYMALYSFVVAFYSLLLKIQLRTDETSAALYLFFAVFTFGAIMVYLQIHTAPLSKFVPEEEEDEDEEKGYDQPVDYGKTEDALGGYGEKPVTLPAPEKPSQKPVQQPSKPRPGY